jgi:hypothetical protein
VWQNCEVGMACFRFHPAAHIVTSWLWYADLHSQHGRQCLSRLLLLPVSVCCTACPAQSVAPYSSVYRPVQSFKALTAGNGTEAGDGGSRGVWTLTVTDKAAGDASRYARPGFRQYKTALCVCLLVHLPLTAARVQQGRLEPGTVHTR